MCRDGRSRCIKLRVELISPVLLLSFRRHRPSGCQCFLADRRGSVSIFDLERLVIDEPLDAQVRFQLRREVAMVGRQGGGRSLL